jgi:hypothetical protein
MEIVFGTIIVLQTLLVFTLSTVLRYSIKKIQIQRNVIAELKESKASLIGLISIRDNYPN